VCTFDSNVGRNLSSFLEIWVSGRHKKFNLGRWAVDQAGVSQSVRKTVYVGLGRSFDP